MMHFSYFTSALVLFAVAASAAENTTLVHHTLRATVAQLPGGKQLQVNAVYQSSNADVIWLETSYDENPHSRGTFYAYAPSEKRITTPHNGIKANDGNHVDQLYYDTTNNYVVVQMEVGENGGQGSYYPKAIDANGNTVWEFKNLTLHRQHSSNTATMGVIDGMAVILHDTGRGPGYVELIGLNIKTGAKAYVKKYYQRIRCNGNTGTCLAVAEQRSGNVLVLFNAYTGATIATHNYDQAPTLHEVILNYIVTAIDGQAYSVDCRTGSIAKLAHRTDGRAGLRQYGPNMVRDGDSSYHVFSVATGLEIFSVLKPVQQFLANWDIIAVATVVNDYQNTWTFQDVNTGTLIGAIPLHNPQFAQQLPFLVGSRLVIPYSATSYQVTDVNTQVSTMASYLASEFSPNIIDLSSGDTFMWNADKYIQFSSRC